jgi:hypothetical protein
VTYSSTPICQLVRAELINASLSLRLNLRLRKVVSQLCGSDLRMLAVDSLFKCLYGVVRLAIIPASGKFIFASA